MTHDFFTKGWHQFGYDQQLAEWVAHALPHARATTTDPEQAQWHRYGNTWFAGVNALSNDTHGAVGNSGPLRGNAVNFIYQQLGLTDFNWDKAQVSICYPGYPQPMEGQSEAMFRFRRDRDAAHVDGLLPEGTDRRRHLREYHLFILGIPMVEFRAEASPFVVWEGSHEIIRTALRSHFGDLPPDQWGEQDITDIYQQTRKDIFDSCKRVEVHAKPGEAYIAHRLVVHGMAPWRETANAGPDGRMICYFRPETDDPFAWLNNP